MTTVGIMLARLFDLLTALVCLWVAWTVYRAWKVGVHLDGADSAICVLALVYLAGHFTANVLLPDDRR